MIRKPKPIREVELDNKNFTLRVILLAVCLTIAFVSIGVGINLLVNKQAGWQKVEISANEMNCSSEFTLQYCFGQGELSAAEEYRSVSLLYSQACEEGYRYFYRDGEFAGINAAPNQPVTVPDALYQALELIQTHGSRYIYLAPVYVEYNRVFLCENEAEAAVYDPARDPELAQWLAELAAFCADPSMINLELLGDNTVRLYVSEQYLDFSRAHEITEFLDFGWLRNAFIADHIADILLDAGYTRGYVASYDGFTRNLDSGSYRINVFDRRDNQVNLPGTVSYQGPASVVYLRDYPMSAADRWHYFAFSDGSIVTAMADPADGLNKSALSDLLAYSYTEGCSEVVLRTAPVYIKDTKENQELTALAADGIYTVWCDENILCYTQEGLEVSLADPEDTLYSTQLVR